MRTETALVALRTQLAAANELVLKLNQEAAQTGSEALSLRLKYEVRESQCFFQVQKPVRTVIIITVVGMFSYDVRSRVKRACNKLFLLCVSSPRQHVRPFDPK